MKFTGHDAMRFAAIHKLLLQHQLQVMGPTFNSQAEVDRAIEQTAELMTSTIPHEAGHAICGLALGAGDVLEWIAIYNVSGGTVGGGCKWGHKPCTIEEQWMSYTAGMAAEQLQYGTYSELSARLDKADLSRANFNPGYLTEYLGKCGALIQSHQTEWHKLQELLYERTIRDFTYRMTQFDEAMWTLDISQGKRQERSSLVRQLRRDPRALEPAAPPLAPSESWDSPAPLPLRILRPLTFFITNSQ